MSSQIIDRLQELFNRRDVIDTEIRQIIKAGIPAPTLGSSFENNDAPPHTIDKAAPTKRAYRKKAVLTSAPKPSIPAGKQWTRKFAKCLDCGGTDKRHIGRGYCAGCYQRNTKGAGPTKKRNPRENRFKDEPVSSAGDEYTCNDCAHSFCSVLDKLAPTCPKCGSVHSS